MFVCGSCHLELNRTHLGVTIIEMFSCPPEPYKLWKADILTCPRCGHQTVQSAHEAYAHHFLDGFDAHMEKALAGPHFFAFERVSDAEESYAAVKELPHDC